MKKILILLFSVIVGYCSAQQVGANQLKKDNYTIKGNTNNQLQADTTVLATKYYVGTTGSGTVTSVTGGSGLTGGTITTSGTLKVDTSLIATRTYVTSGASVDTSKVPYTGALRNVNLGSNTLFTTGSIGSTGTRVLKSWFTDLEVTNAPTLGGVAASGTGGLIRTTSPTFITDITTPKIIASSSNVLIDGSLYPTPTNSRGLGTGSNVWSAIVVNNTLTGAIRPISSTILLQNAGATLTYGTFDLRTASSGAVTDFSFNPGAHTNQTLSTEIPSFKIVGGSRQWATGAITTQRENYISSTTYTAVGASTITSAYGLYVEKPTQSTNVTITNNWGLGVEGGAYINGAISLPYNLYTSLQTLGATQYNVNLTNAGATYAITLPTAVGVTGKIYRIKQMSGTACTVATTSAQNIKSLTNTNVEPLTLIVGAAYIEFQSDGTNWIQGN